MEEGKNQTFVDKIWSFFSSITLAVVLIALIAITSIVGTIIEQNAPPEKNLALIERLFGEHLTPTLYNFFEQTGFMDMYHSWWFVTLLLLLSANLIICSLDRLPRILKLVREQIKPLSEEQFKNIGKKEIVLKGKLEKTKDVVGTALKRGGFNLLETKEANGYQLYSEKGNYTRLGIYITHLSILLIFIGALIGIFFGFKGFMELPEGESRSFAFTRRGAFTRQEESAIEMILRALQATEGSSLKAARQLGMDEKTLRTKMKRYGIFPLDFSIKCDNFSVDFYGRSSMPKEYKSWLTVIKDGREVIKKTIVVNDPLTYNGISFYQSSYGIVPNAYGEFILKITSKTGVSESRQMHLNDRFIIPGTDIEGVLKDFSPALSFDERGRPFTLKKEQMDNPAVFIEFSEKGQTKYSGWLMKRHPETWSLPDGHIVEFVDVWGVEYTGLQVRRDPGVWVVYLGCAVMSIGLYIAFFMSHKRIWVRLVEERNNTRIIFATTANKNRPAFERKIDKMIALLSKSSTKGAVPGRSGGGGKK